MNLINAERFVRDIVVVGASAGGIRAVIRLLSRLPADFPASVGVVIHRGNRSQLDWSTMLGKESNIRVVQPEDGARLSRGVVFVAPPDYHMRFGGRLISLDHGEKQHHTRPAVNPLFSSAAVAYGPRVVGVVLTGGGSDGLQGLLDITAAGGLSLAQSLSEAEHTSMPEHAIVGDHVDAVLSVDAIGDALVQLANGDAVTLIDR
jgi:two-component system, chemotaxis family, protein-glutamate methylesterase/glutaminase